MRKACVIGWPIGHSRSPLIHGYWIAQYRLDATYTKVGVPPDELATFLSTLKDRGFSGCNVTLPHKEAAYHLVDIADEHTRRLGAVNTVFMRDGKTLGTNTDGEGFINNLRHSLPGIELKEKMAVVLGAGGAAASICGALLECNVSKIAVVNRSIDRANALCQRFGTHLFPVPWTDRDTVLDGCGLVVNTTSLGMTGQPPLDIGLDRLPQSAIVTDIVYSPLRTPLLVQAAKRGHRVVEGLGMLLHQAVRGFELWFGTRPEVTNELYDIVARDIDPDFGRS